MNKITRRLFVVFSAVMLIVLAGCGANSGSKEKTDGKSSGKIDAKIGVVAYMTGSGAAYGEAITNGFKLAQKEINEQGDVNIELVTEDSAGKQEQALSAGKKLMSDQDIVALLGPTLSTEFQVVAPEADMSGISIMGTSTTAEGIPQIGNYVFRNSIPEALAIPAAMEKVVAKTKAKKVAIIYGNDDVFTKSGYDTMKKEAEKMSLEVVTTETFQKGQSDYNAQLTKIKSKKPDFILASALYNEGAVIMDQARKMGIDVPFVGGNGFNSPQVIEIAGDAANGLVVATPWFGDSTDQKVVDFNKKFKDEYGKLPDQFAAQAYDALYIYADALKRAGQADREAFHKALAKTKDFNGILGRFSFDKEGDVVMEPKVVEIKDGKFKEFE